MDRLISDYFSDFFLHRLDRLEQNLSKLEKSLSVDEERYCKENAHIINIIESKKEKSETERVYVDFFHDDIALYDESRQFYRQSSFLMLYAFLEDSLQKLCKVLVVQYKHNIEVDDLKGSGVLRAKTWFEKVAHINIPDDLWGEVDKYRLIRNQLVHEFGELGKEQAKKVHEIVKTKGSLETHDWGYTEFIRMKDDFLNEFIGVIKKLYLEIDKEIGKYNAMK